MATVKLSNVFLYCYNTLFRVIQGEKTYDNIPKDSEIRDEQTDG